MRKLLLATCLLLPISAQAHSWWLLNAESATCIPASSTIFTSPEISSRLLLDSGITPKIHMFKTDSGTVYGASIVTHFNGSYTILLFFTEKYYCQAFKVLAKEKGLVIAPNALR